MYTIRKTKIEDINNILNIYSDAKVNMRNNNINQWNDNYPNYETILNDINNDESYVLVKDNIIYATAMVSKRNDKTYLNIEGNWGNNSNYIVIHRFVSNTLYLNKGIATIFLKLIEDKFNDITIRIDTHKDNYSMKNFLTKNKFIFRGIIYLENGESRDAYDKIR